MSQAYNDISSVFTTYYVAVDLQRVVWGYDHDIAGLPLDEYGNAEARLPQLHIHLLAKVFAPEGGIPFPHWLHLIR